MLDIAMLEQERLTLQHTLDASKTSSERNRLGQFATPPALATDILCCAQQLIPPHQPIRFLDPAIGTGAFYAALRHVFAASRIAQAVGYEVDPHYGLPAARLWEETALQLHLEDFTQATPSNEHLKANLVICNPPYVRHHHLTAPDKARLQQLVQQITGLRLSGLSSLYCYFLCLTHAWMADGGIAGWLIPSEFMDVNYGHQIKQYLLDQVTLLRIHRFEAQDRQFGDAIVSSAVVWFKKTPPPVTHEVAFTYGGSLTQPRTTTTLTTQTLRTTIKWTHVQLTRNKLDSVSGILRLADFFKIQRGLATGANEFFILTPEQITQYEIPVQFLTPILPSPRHISMDEIEADANGAPILKHKHFLLTCSLPEPDVETNHPALWRYLQHGVEQGIHERYLCKHRSPWYSQEKRPAPPLLCTYMGRQDTKAGRPFRFLLNHSRATAANVYLLLYPKPTLQGPLQQNPSLYRSIWEALNQLTPAMLSEEGRVYGGGLHKLEPKELGNLPAAFIKDVVSCVDPAPHVEQLRIPVEV
jgi:predicted RNA methylase